MMSSRVSRNLLFSSISSISRSCQQRAFAAAAAAAIDIEHGRGQWKTYGNIENYKPGKFQIKTFNKLSPVGLERFADQDYEVVKGEDQDGQGSNAHAILIRSHKLSDDDVPHTTRAIARCGAGTNNINVARMTKLGIPVFNTPGANANAVMELVICGVLLGSRRVIDGINHMKTLGEQGIARERVEKDKAMFGGREIKNKNLSVIGLGHIGSITAHTADNLGMTLSGYDPGLSVQSALKLPRNLKLEDSIAAAVANADYISLNIPYVKGEGGTHGIIGKEVMTHFKPDAVLLNFARGELVDSDAMKEFLDANPAARYVSDFPDDALWNHPNVILLPHLGASTTEAEDAACTMAVDTVREFLESGTIRNSVNFPATSLADRPGGTVRFTVVNQNVPGVLAEITNAFAHENLNIVQQINQSRGDIAYNVLDIGTDTGHENVLSFKKVQERITMLEGVLSSRILYGLPGTGYARNLEGEYFV
eukprot:CAMPEP_0198142324 /NCGR_PEP_ID=MMETSP1443-20131203/5130_1 /TAXON_ID=186043 /ORGANISM="Entomoneis sp., Strain CCMP2396" /LENGTH=478 /DNA_ID=CAMNT_0043805295 /DNA_START=76 /DNA_END=1512 /DNA_ORIENTATION=-